MIADAVARLRDWWSGKTEFTARSPKWDETRKRWLVIHPCCEVCGITEDVEVHHLVPVHIDPTKELDETNFISLCRTHHLLFGHLLNWKSYNSSCRDDCWRWKVKIKARP